MSNNGLGTLISHVQLKDNNFDKHAKAIQMALEPKKKLCFIVGTTPQPNETDPKFKRWKKINTMIRSWILNAIEPSLNRQSRR